MMAYGDLDQGSRNTKHKRDQFEDLSIDWIWSHGSK